MTFEEWVIFSDNGITEMRFRFEEFGRPPTALSRVADFAAYLDREVLRTIAISPEACWSAMHAAYLAMVTNARDGILLILDEKTQEALKLYDRTGVLNHTFTKLQDAAALKCE